MNPLRPLVPGVLPAVLTTLEFHPLRPPGFTPVVASKIVPVKTLVERKNDMAGILTLRVESALRRRDSNAR